MTPSDDPTLGALYRDLHRALAVGLSTRAAPAEADQTSGYWLDVRFDPDDPRQLSGWLWRITSDGATKKNTLLTDQLAGQLHYGVSFEEAAKMRSIVVCVDERAADTYYLCTCFSEPDGTMGRTALMAVEGLVPKPSAAG